MKRMPFLFLSCEHASHRVPWAFRKIFTGARTQALLKTHRGWDIGALKMAKLFQKDLGGRLIAGQYSRLLCDLNRSEGNPFCFSDFTRHLNSKDREKILASHYRPYRKAMEAEIRRGLKMQNRVIHFSVHSFTPRLYGKTRKADIGLLYDPSRPLERSLALLLKRELRVHHPQLRVRLNYPYKGTADGAIPAYRQKFPAARYVGLEFEFNQALAPRFAQVYQALGPCLRRVLMILE